MEINEPFHESDLDLSAYVDDELGHAERLRVAAHLETCTRCRQEVERFRQLTALLRAADEEESAGLGEISLWPAIERQIGGGAAAPRSIVERWRRWAPAWARPVWVPLAVAVVLVLVIVLPLMHQTATSQADEAIVESVDQGEVMVLKGGKKSTIIWVFGK
jgi:anti-sigma factor RsiW